MQRAPIRTLLIEDSAWMRRIIGDLIKSDDSFDLVGIANDGRTGSEMALGLKPDVIVTDMVMPDYDGMYVVQSVMEKQPTPIILLSSLEKSNARIFDALQCGAFEFIDKPANFNSLSREEYPLTALIKEAARMEVSRLKARRAGKNNHAHSFSHRLAYDIVAIGASTGGPGAIEWIINNLPGNFQLPIVIAQHMPSRFLETFAVRLNEHSPIPVRLARRGEEVDNGIIYIASGDSNPRIERQIVTGKPFFSNTNQRYKEFNNPSVDCLFESVASTFQDRSIAILLTGMGKDGMMGMSKVHARGGFTIAQDEESSVVFGMPKAAIDNGAVNRVVRLKEMPGFIVSCL